MIGECSCSCDEGILVEGAFWLMEIDIGELASTLALGAAASETRETTIVGGLNPDSREQFGQPVMTREEEDGISVALDPKYDWVPSGLHS
ncbi:hypothetical protein Tco_0828004 [Tanacetum coccineum]